ncbi:LOW QUALITY PROTEIN: hypothetical protein T265_13876 [Opisthorchis viverrini]|uniref:Reverse transcriptase domain-containing protein n=1 Tax=Opisthorchis viverrini TaxID=6198 RepID=A0A074ZUI9_OPIVI|nr:LOW QUALITY PROTEIN: hypothetical protein T265_13876 [Opisthorchis viverrini]KER27050.1 LOW QUALITY PROTEIN: hypothetical protein T265_13876 [Opisthorchis viverrini]
MYTCIEISQTSYQMKHEAAWCNTFSCLKTSQARDSAGLQRLAAMPPEGNTRVEKLSGCPSLDRGSRGAEVGFEPRTFRSVNSRSNHLSHLAVSMLHCRITTGATPSKETNPVRFPTIGGYQTLTAGTKRHSVPCILLRLGSADRRLGSSSPKSTLLKSVFKLKSHQNHTHCRQSTHRDLHQYTRLPFGVKTSPETFQQLMDTILSGISGGRDDVLIIAVSLEKLLDRISAVFLRIHDDGLRLCPEKSRFVLTTVKYLGFISDASGRHPDPKNFRAIQQMPPPKDVPSLHSFFGLTIYNFAFFPSLHKFDPQ